MIQFNLLGIIFRSFNCLRPMGLGERQIYCCDSVIIKGKDISFELTALLIKNGLSSIETRFRLSLDRVRNMFQTSEAIFLSVGIIVVVVSSFDEASRFPHNLLVFVFLIPELATVYYSPNFVYRSDSSYEYFFIEENDTWAPTIILWFFILAAIERYVGKAV